MLAILHSMQNSQYLFNYVSQMILPQVCNCVHIHSHSPWEQRVGKSQEAFINIKAAFS